MHWILYLSTNDLELAMLTNIIFVQNKRDTQKSVMKHFPIFHLHISLIQIHREVPCKFCYSLMEQNIRNLERWLRRFGGAGGCVQLSVTSSSRAERYQEQYRSVSPSCYELMTAAQGSLLCLHCKQHHTPCSIFSSQCSAVTLAILSILLTLSNLLFWST